LWLILFDWFPPNLFSAALAGEFLLDPLLLARLQIEGVFFDFSDDIFLLDFSLKAPQSIFRFAILNTNLCQSLHPNLVAIGF
jgi:hypothetical protein